MQDDGSGVENSCGWKSEEINRGDHQHKNAQPTQALHYRSPPRHSLRLFRPSYKCGRRLPPAAEFVGVLPGSAKIHHRRKQLQVRNFIRRTETADYSAKQLEAVKFHKTFLFSYLKEFFGRQILVLLAIPAGPADHHSIDVIVFSQTKCYREFGLRKIARTAAHQAGGYLSIVIDLDVGADGVAI